MVSEGPLSLISQEIIQETTTFSRDLMTGSMTTVANASNKGIHFLAGVATKALSLTTATHTRD